ncbi:MAG: hypothetical protein GY822_23470 [Deltaproteobacteria bacterium]|nr:hypothetical protein [Deltaproteobacteria bacterium]
MRIWSVFSFVLFLSLPMGCPVPDGQEPEPSVDAGDDVTDAGMAGLTPTDHVCAHAENGPDESVTAGADEATAPTLAGGMKRYTVALHDDGMGTFAGVLLLDSAQMGAWHFAFVSDDATANATFAITQNGANVMTMDMNVDQCSDLASAMFMADLEMDTQYVMHLANVSAAEAKLVVVNPLDGHMHHMDDAGMHHMDDAGMHMDDAGM